MYKLVCLAILTTAFVVVAAVNYDRTEIHGYHFHTYFFQKDDDSTQEAREFRQEIQRQIEDGLLANCRLNRFNMDPVGPHPVGSFETCCNKTSLSQSLSWFMQNRGNLTIFLHPLTTEEILDHTVRSSFLGSPFKLKISALETTLAAVDLCLPLTTSNDV
ncbi:unnamed protein product [Allacma fusca]|uniref:DOPA 4,5-dioxygenase n=1 Tax=Allacma fusca TaxID=39272 RepID=A0A8J2P6M4_9HEXA|nr:unnamed protein product [Allacma fusca]